MTTGRQQVIKIGRYYYVGDYSAKTSLALSLDIQQARWFDSTKEYDNKKMDIVCFDYCGERRDLLDELKDI